MAEEKKCQVSWCNGKALANTLCKKHYRRQRRKGQAVHLDHPDVKGVLDAGLKVLSFAEELVLKAHKTNGHKSSFELCEVGSCKIYHEELVSLFASKEEVHNDSESPRTESA